MINLLIRIGAASLLVGIVLAQELPRSELYGGYSFLRANSAISVPAFTANGGIAAFQFNVNKNIGVLGDFGGYHNGNVGGVQLDSTMFSYLFGPRLFAHKDGRISPFFEALFGGMHYTRSFQIPVTVNPRAAAASGGGRIKNEQDAFSMAYGGGIDLKLNRTVAFRPIQLDYVMTRFQPLFIAGLGEINRDRNQNNLRYSTGFAFRF